MTRPGSRLRWLAARLFDAPTLERLIDPVIADLQHEHESAVRSGHRWRARSLWITGALAFWKVAAINMVSMSATQPAWATADGGAVGRTIRFSGIATTVTTAILVWPPMRQAFAVRGDWDLTLLTLYLLPQALAVTLPIGLVFGVLCGLRGRVPAVRSKTTIIVLAAAVSLATLVITGWLLPVANQAFRILTAGRPVARGLNELSLREVASRDPYSFHMRLALASAPLILGAFSLALAASIRSRTRAVTVGLIALAICFAYYVLLYGGRAQALAHRVPGFVGAWAPNLAFAAGALLLHLRTRARSAADPSRPDDGRRSADRPAAPPA